MKFGHPADSAAMERMVLALESFGPTYTDIGATLAGKQPGDLLHDRVGEGAQLRTRGASASRVGSVGSIWRPPRRALGDECEKSI